MLKNTQKHILRKSLGVSCLLQWMSMILKMPHYFQGKGEHLKGVTFSEDLVSYFGYFIVKTVLPSRFSAKKWPQG